MHLDTRAASLADRRGAGPTDASATVRPAPRYVMRQAVLHLPATRLAPSLSHVAGGVPNLADRSCVCHGSPGKPTLDRYVSCRWPPFESIVKTLVQSRFPFESGWSSTM